MEKVTREDELELISIENNYADIVEIPRSKKKFKVKWLMPRQVEKLSLLELDSGISVTEDDSVSNVKKRAQFLSKAVAYCLLNGWKLTFLHWLYWRYLYYIKTYSSDQLLPIIQMAKKKATPVESYLGMILVAQMKNTKPMLTAEEREQFQAGLS